MADLKWGFSSEKLFHFTSVSSSATVKLIKEKLALDLLQMFLSKQINLRGVNIKAK